MKTRYKVGRHTQQGTQWAEYKTFDAARSSFDLGCTMPDTWWIELLAIDRIGRRRQRDHWHNKRLHDEIMEKARCPTSSTAR